MGTLKDESESDSARDAGVGLRIVNETLAGGAADEDMAVQVRDALASATDVGVNGVGQQGQIISSLLLAARP